MRTLTKQEMARLMSIEQVRAGKEILVAGNNDKRKKMSF